MKKILVLIAVLTAMLLTFGMAHAIIIEHNSTPMSLDYSGNGNQNVVRLLGVADDAPGNDLVVPFICGKDAANNLDTLWAIAETQNLATTLHYYVYNVRSNFVYDSEIDLTGRDIEPDSCKALIGRMSEVQRGMVEKTIGGVKYYAGYIVYDQQVPANRNNIIGWQYLVDLSKGFAAGFNSYIAQNSVTFTGMGTPNPANPNLCELTLAGTPVCSTAAWMYPRFYIMNDNADSFNWWIILAGTNNANRGLTGVFCDETEVCISTIVQIPDELNIINVSEHIPAALFGTRFPKAGYGSFAVRPYENNSTTIGWSYQRAASTAGASLSWSVIHPIHKDY